MEFKMISKLLTTMILILCLPSCGSQDSDSRVVISSGDTIIVLNSLQYQFPLVVQVADLQGSPQPNIEVSFVLTTTSFDKGSYTHVDTDVPPDGTTDEWKKTTTNDFACPTEDVNNNGVLDAGEDTNFNTLLDPDTPTITFHPTEEPTILGGTNSLITDENGFGYLTITYPKSIANWVTIKLTATASDGLTENIGVFAGVIPGSIPDIQLPDDNSPAFEISPYGTSATCTNAS